MSFSVWWESLGMSHCAQKKGRPKKPELISSLLQFAKKKKSDVTLDITFFFFVRTQTWNQLFKQEASNRGLKTPSSLL